MDGGYTVDGERLGVVFSSGIGGLHTALNSYDVFKEKGWSRVSPFTVPMLMPNGASGHVGIEFGAMVARTPWSAPARPAARPSATPST